jgi:3-phosphoshikimate 1-carboxyvinyltransferase
MALFSLLAQGSCRVSNFSTGQDCHTSLEAVKTLGGKVEQDGQDIILSGAGGWLTHRAVVDCGNSGTTMRLLMGILAGQNGRYRLDGDDSLRRRPMQRVAAPLAAMGGLVNCCQGLPPVEITGGSLHGIGHVLTVASAQLKSALLLAGLQAKGVTRVEEPAPSRDHTERLLAWFGADLSQDDGGWQIRASDLRLPDQYRVPGDISSAAFFLCAAACLPGSEVVAQGVGLNPTRTGFLKVLARMGADLTMETSQEEPEPWGQARVGYTQELKGCEVTAQEIPGVIDEIPILALVATQAKGITVFRQVGELRIKESDRLAAIIEQLGAMGGLLETKGDDLLIKGPTLLHDCSGLDAGGDHRMAMTLRLAGLLAGARPEIAGEQSAAISFPEFGRTLEELLT